jgi:hypothetical protein
MVILVDLTNKIEINLKLISTILGETVMNLCTEIERVDNTMTPTATLSTKAKIPKTDTAPSFQTTTREHFRNSIKSAHHTNNNLKVQSIRFPLYNKIISNNHGLV